MKDKLKISFDPNAKDFVLDAFDHKVNKEGFIVSKYNENKFILNIHGEKVHIDSFIGYAKNKQILDHRSLVLLTEENNEE